MPVTINGTTGITNDGTNLVFTGTGQRITGDFSNAAVANRVAFQTSTTNTTTSVAAIPSGTGISASWDTYSAADPGNASLGRMQIVGGTDFRIVSTLTGTGAYLPTTFYTGGSERMRVTTGGNIGVGTASPNKSGSTLALTVNAALGSYPALELSTGDVGRWYINADATNVYDTCLNSTNRTFYTGGSERMRIDSSGNVGIGTSSPQSLLDLTGNDPTLRLTDNAGSPAATFSIRSADASFRVRDVTNSADRLTIDSAGKVILSAAGQGIQFADGTTQTTAAGGAPSALAVGSYIIGRPNNTNNYNAGDTIAGGSLFMAPPGSQYDGSFSDGGTSVSSGTWRCMSRNFQKVFAGPTYVGLMGLWCRIS